VITWPKAKSFITTGGLMAESLSISFVMHRARRDGTR